MITQSDSIGIPLPVEAWGHTNFLNGFPPQRDTSKSVNCFRVFYRLSIVSGEAFANVTQRSVCMTCSGGGKRRSRVFYLSQYSRKGLPTQFFTITLPCISFPLQPYFELLVQFCNTRVYGMRQFFHGDWCVSTATMTVPLQYLVYLNNSHR